MELGQWVLGSEWETHTQNQRGKAKMEVKDIIQSCPPS